MTDRETRPDEEGHEAPTASRARDRSSSRPGRRQGPRPPRPTAAAPPGQPDEAEPQRAPSPPARPSSGRGELEAARAELAEYRDQLQRMSADFDNARKRMLKDQTHAIERASERLVAQLLEVLDEFQLAMLHGEQAPEFEPYLKGVRAGVREAVRHAPRRKGSNGSRRRASRSTRRSTRR